MSLLIACSQCGSQFKAPERVAGRTVRCLKCKASISVPALQPAAAAATPPAPPPLPAADAGSADVRPRPTTWLTALLFTGMGVAFFLVIALLIILLNREPLGGIAEAPKGMPAPIPESMPSPFIQPESPPTSVTPPETKPQPETKPPPPDRAERLAALETQEKEILPALAAKADKHKPALQKLRQDENALFPKTIKMNAAQIAKLKARTDAFVKEQSTVVRPAIKDAVAMHRKREELLQARRKLMFDYPEAGEIKVEEYNGMFLTADEIRDLAKREASAATPRAAALNYVEGDEIKMVLKGHFYAGMYQEPGVEDMAAIVYRTNSYRERSDLQVHVYLYRLRGVWQVLELPGRPNAVYLGLPPSEFKKMDSGL